MIERTAAQNIYLSTRSLIAISSDIYLPSIVVSSHYISITLIRKKRQNLL